jgi:hypothetical protein
MQGKSNEVASSSTGQCSQMQVGTTGGSLGAGRVISETVDAATGDDAEQ